MISREPQRINSTTWYYENPRSFDFVIECRSENGYHKTIQFRVLARTLEASLKRMDKAKSRKRT